MESEKENQDRKGKGHLKNLWQFLSSISWFISAYMALAVFVLLKNFVVDVVRINSRDMEPALQYGEAYLITKCGNDFNRFDQIYFRHPMVDSSMTHYYMLQRIVGLPGENLEIKNGDIFINGEKLSDGPLVKQNYFISATQALDSAFLAEHGIQDGGAVSSSFDYSFALSDSLVTELKKQPFIKSIERRMENAGRYDENCFPYHPHYAWNADHYGAIYLPKEQDTLRLDTGNISLYSQLILEHEKNDLRISADSIFVNGSYTQYYVVKKNYFFVLGDNRGNANDSRNWGYLPENLIVGKLQKRLRAIP